MPSEDFNNHLSSNTNTNEARLIRHFEAKAKSHYLALNKVVPQLTLAAKLIVKTLLNENKILVCANGVSTSLAQYLAAEFINRYETARPALPAFSLTADSTVLAAINNESQYDEIFSRQIQALGKSNDMLFIFVSNELNNALVNALETAHELKMKVILICGELSEDISSYLNSSDITISLELENQPQILEAQLFSIHSICDLTDHLLFGTP